MYVAVLDLVLTIPVYPLRILGVSSLFLILLVCTVIGSVVMAEMHALSKSSPIIANLGMRAIGSLAFEDPVNQAELAQLGACEGACILG